MTGRRLELHPGSTFRGLLVHSLLGRGGMGSAYIASHPVLQIPVVIKTFESSVGEDIFQEAYLAARVLTPYTVSVLDAGLEDGLPFVVQRYVDGIDLAELLRRAQDTGQRMPINFIVKLIMHAAQGLHVIHQARVVHRDVKPANIFLRGNGVASIGDFGIAIQARSHGGVVYAGTPQFMAPEQWEGKDLDRRTDVYALGATAHYLVTSHAPFIDDRWDQLKAAHCGQPYIPPVAREPYAAFLFSAIEKMLQKDPAHRYQTTLAVSEALAVIDQPQESYTRLNESSFRVGNLMLRLSVGDLAAARADVLVSAANWALHMNVGVAGALRHAGGEAIEKEAMAHAPAAMGDVVWTGAGNLNAKWVAHAVAALEGAICIQRCALRILLEAEARKARSVAFPALGTGVGKVPMELAAQLMLEAIKTFAGLKFTCVRYIDIVLHDLKAHQSWLDIINSI